MGCQKDATNLLLHKTEDGNGSWKAFERDSSVTINNMATGDATKVEILDASCTITSNNKDLSENGVANFYADRSVERELPELVVCYREPTYHVVKDICVDEGAPSKEKIMVENTEDNKTGQLSKENASIGIAIPDGVKSGKEDNYKEECGDYEESIRTDEGNDDGEKTTANGIARENVMPPNIPMTQELHAENPTPELTSFDGNEREQHSDLTLHKAMVESKVTGAVSELSSHSKPESGRTSIHVDSPPAEASTRGKTPLHWDHRHSHDTENTNSFTAGPSSAHITYSGPIAYSGSVSLRSDSSTTSTRSFAFPVLQPEWNSSPVKMVKPDRKQFRKQKRWRQGLFCCRF